MSGLRKEKKRLSQERVRELFDYDPETGDLIRRLHIQCKNGYIGCKPGTIMKGNYTRITVDKIRIFKHVLVWLWYYGEYPGSKIRHINGDHTDDRIKNLTLKYESYVGSRLTQSRVRELFDYAPETGDLIRKVKTINSKEIGETYDSINGNGYKTLKIDGKTYPLHRIVWLWYYGYLPENLIDHRSKNKLDNSIDNLREVSNSCNTRNCSVYSSNTTGVKGVTLRISDKYFVARIFYNGRNINVGSSRSLTEAVCHRYAIEQCLNWNTCDINSPAYLYLKEHGIIK